MTQGKVSSRITNPPTGGGVTDHGALTGLADDDHAQYATADGLRGNFEAAGAVSAHAAAADPHTGYQKESEKGAANGYASLSASTVVPPAQLGTGSGGATKFLREDSTWQTVSGGSTPTGTGFRHVTAGVEDAASKKVDLAEPADITGTLPAGNGGTGQTTYAKGDLLVGKDAALDKLAVGGTDGMMLAVEAAAAAGISWQAPFTRISGASGAAGPYVTWQRLSANAAEITSQTPQVVMTTTGVGAGTWSFKYKLVYRSGDTLTTNGVGVAVNHTGTTGTFVMNSWYVTTGTTAVTGVADQVGGADQLVEGKSERVKNTCSSPTAGVDTAAADMLLVVEGMIVVTVSGSLELKVRSELAAAATDGISVRADTLLELNKVA